MIILLLDVTLKTIKKKNLFIYIFFYNAEYKFRSLITENQRKRRRRRKEKKKRRRRRKRRKRRKRRRRRKKERGGVVCYDENSEITM